MHTKYPGNIQIPEQKEATPLVRRRRARPFLLESSKLEMSDDTIPIWYHSPGITTAACILFDGRKTTMNDKRRSADSPSPQRGRRPTRPARRPTNTPVRAAPVQVARLRGDAFDQEGSSKRPRRFNCSGMKKSKQIRCKMDRRYCRDLSGRKGCK